MDFLLPNMYALVVIGAPRYLSVFLRSMICSVAVLAVQVYWMIERLLLNVDFQNWLKALLDCYNVLGIVHILQWKNCCPFTGVSRWLERDMTIILSMKANCYSYRNGMVKRWSILQRPIAISIRNIKHFIWSIGVLHNYCINEQIVHCSGNGIFVPENTKFSPEETVLQNSVAEFDERIWYMIL